MDGIKWKVVNWEDLKRLLQTTRVRGVLFFLSLVQIFFHSVESFVVNQQIQYPQNFLIAGSRGTISAINYKKCDSQLTISNKVSRRWGNSFCGLKANQNQQEISPVISPAIALENEDKEEITVSKSEISLEGLESVDIRSGVVLMADLISDPEHDNKPSRKYLKLLVDVGFERRQIISGIRSLFDPEDVIGKSLMVVVNTKVEEILGLPSHGRILIANHYSKKPMPRSLRTVLQKVGLPPGSTVQIA